MEILNYAGNRSLYCIDIRVFGGKLVKNSFTCCWLLSVIFAHFHVRLYIPWVSSYSGVWSLQGSSYICILVKLDPFRFRKSPPQRENIAKYSCKEVDLGRICSTNSIFVMQQSFRLGHRTTLYHEGLIKVNRNLDKSLYKKEDFKHWDR